MQEQQTRPLFLSWSSRESLLLVPQYAWLSLHDVSHVRLPQRLDTLREKLEIGCRPWSPDPKMKLLWTPLGQWIWAVRNLQDSFLNDNKKEIPLRLTALRRFAVRNWPGWFEKTLDGLLVRLHSSSLSSESVQVLTQQAPAVAVLEACRPLLGWLNHEGKGKRIAIFEDALSYLEQGVGEISHIITLAEEDPWWDDIGVDLAEAEMRVLQAKQGGASVDRALSDGLAVIRNCIEPIHHLGDFAAGTGPARIHATRTAIQLLTQTIGAIHKLHSQAFEHANFSH